MNTKQFEACPFCGDEHFGKMEMTYMHDSGPTKGFRIKCNTCGAQAPDTVWNTRAAISSAIESNAQEVCKTCGGDGIDRCTNPDHGFIAAIGGEEARLGCPVCGHDDQHRVPDKYVNGKWTYCKCPDCNGTGKPVNAQEDVEAAPVAGWKYEYHDFGDVWTRACILNNPDGTANPPTKHYGNKVRNVQPLFAAPPLSQIKGEQSIPAEAVIVTKDAGSWVPMPTNLHTDTKDLVARFAWALATKLYKAEQKYGYSNGWRDTDWLDECREKLLRHIAKGDPRDVAAYCAFLWHHNASTAPIATQAPVEEVMEALIEELWACESDYNYMQQYISDERIISWLIARATTVKALLAPDNAVKQENL